MSSTSDAGEKRWEFKKENNMESMAQKLKDLQERKPDAFVILGAVSGFGAERIKEISEGSEMTLAEKIVLKGLSEMPIS